MPTEGSRHCRQLVDLKCIVDIAESESPGRSVGGGANLQQAEVMHKGRGKSHGNLSYF